MTTYRAGQSIKATVTFTPAATYDDVALADVVALAVDIADGTVVTLAPGQDSTNVFSAVIDVPRTARDGEWIVEMYATGTTKAAWVGSFTVEGSAA